MLYRSSVCRYIRSGFAKLGKIKNCGSCKHDYDFLGRITNCIIDIDFGTITRYTGDLKHALRQKEADRESY